MPKNDAHYGSSQFRSFDPIHGSTVSSTTAGIDAPGENAQSRPYAGSPKTRPMGKVTPSRKVNNNVPKKTEQPSQGHSDGGDFSKFYANNTGEYLSPEDRVVAEEVMGTDSNVISL